MTVDDLIAEIENTGYDLLKFRFISNETSRGTFPLDEFPEAIDSIRKMIKFGACSSIRPESQFRKPFRQAELLIEACEMAQTEAGSFVVSVKVPVKPVDERDKYSLGRKTVVQLLNGINEAKNTDISNEKQFRNNYDKKLSKNVCDAVTELLEIEHTFDLEISAKWDVSLAVEKSSVASITLESKDHLKRFNKMSSYLLKIPQSETTTIQGLINIMKHTHLNTPSEKRLIIVSDTRTKRKVYVHLENELYQKACDAHRDMKQVKIEGYLNKKQVHWSLDQPEEFTVLDKKK